MNIGNLNNKLRTGKNTQYTPLYHLPYIHIAAGIYNLRSMGTTVISTSVVYNLFSHPSGLKPY